MEGNWIKTVDQGRRVIKKDPLGFWLVHFQSREAPEKHNPFVYPSNVCQVFFLDDVVDPAWKVVLRHDPRSKRIEGEREVHVFGASGSVNEALSTRSRGRHAPNRDPSTSQADQDEEFLVEQVNVIVYREENPEDENHLSDLQYEDEFDLQYIE